MPNPRSNAPPRSRKVLLSAFIAVLVLGTAFFIWSRKRLQSPTGLDGPVSAAILVPDPVADTGQGDGVAKAALEEVPAVAVEETPALPPPMLHGRVVGEGSGIEGAFVTLFSSKGIEDLIERLESLAPSAGELPDFEPIIASVRAEFEGFRASGITTKTQAGGIYEFRGLQPASYFVLTVADDWLFRYGDVVNLALDRSEALDLVLDRGAQIAGRVVNMAGEVVPGATVLAEFRPANMAGLGIVVRRLLRYVNGEFLKGPFQTTTGADGRFAIASLPPGMYDVAAYQIEGVEARATQVESGSTEVVVVLGSPAQLRARFADGQGKPAANLPVRLELKDDLIQLALPVPGFDKIANTVNRFVTGGPRKTETNARGELAAAALSPGKYKLSVEYRGYLPLEKEFELSWGQTLDLGLVTLSRGASIDGFVRSTDGRPLEGAKVLAMPAKMNPMLMGGIMVDVASGRTTALTKADGAFRLRGLVKGQYRLTALCAGFAPAVKNKVGTEDEPVIIEMKPGVRVTGRVLAALDSTPIAGAKVNVQMARTRTDEEGNFILEGVSPRDPSGNPFGGMNDELTPPEEPSSVVEVEATAPGFMYGDEDVDLSRGEPHVELLLRRAPQVAGMVLDPDGKPAPGALVRLTPAIPDMPFDFFDTGMIFVAASVSDLEGKFLFKEIKGANKRTQFRVIADHVLYSRGSSESFTFRESLDKDEPHRVEVKLVRGGRLRGLVTDGTKPVSGAAVRLARAQKSGNGEQFGMFMNMLGLPKSGDLAYTNKEGQFEHNRILPGEYLVNAELAGFMDSPQQAVSVAPGDDRELNFVVDPGGEIHGTIVDNNGDAVPAARVRIFKEAPASTGERDREREMLEAQKFFGGSYKSTRAGDDGTFHIPGLPPALSYTVSAEHPGFVAAEVSGVQPSMGETRLVLHRAAALAGIVLDSGSGQPIQNFRVSVEESREPGQDKPARELPEEWKAREYNDASGRFERKDLRPGAHSVRVRAAGYAPEQEEIFLTAGGRVEQTFYLARAGRIRGLVLDQVTQSPIAGARVRLSRSQPEAATSVEAGKESTTARRARRDRDRAEREGRKTAADTRSDSEAMNDHLAEEWTPTDSVQTAADGSFLLEDVPAGPQRLKVTHGDYVPAVQEAVEVPLGTEAEVTLALRPGVSIQGLVLDGAGNPAPSRLVYVRGASAESASISRSGLADASGKFHVGGLEKGTYRLVVAAQPGKKVTSDSLTVDVQGPLSNIEIRVTEVEQ